MILNTDTVDQMHALYFPDDEQRKKEHTQSYHLRKEIQGAIDKLNPQNPDHEKIVKSILSHAAKKPWIPEMGYYDGYTWFTTPLLALARHIFDNGFSECLESVLKDKSSSGPAKVTIIAVLHQRETNNSHEGPISPEHFLILEKCSALELMEHHSFLMINDDFADMVTKKVISEKDIRAEIILAKYWADVLCDMLYTKAIEEKMDDTAWAIVNRMADCSSLPSYKQVLLMLFASEYKESHENTPEEHLKNEQLNLIQKILLKNAPSDTLLKSHLDNPLFLKNIDSALFFLPKEAMEAVLPVLHEHKTKNASIVMSKKELEVSLSDFHKKSLSRKYQL